jgi:hypothetical protein
MTVYDIPNEFTLEFEEVDRKKASHYINPCGCLVSTGVKRLFPGVRVLETISAIRIEVPGSVEALIYEHEDCSSQDLYAFIDRKRRPFYGPEVVGMKLNFKRMMRRNTYDYC